MAKTKSSEMEEGSMGFKDKQKALDTLKFLDERDISYQYHVITSFVSRVKRTLQITKDEEKLSNLRDALKVFEDWLTDYKENNRGKENLAYLPIETIKAYRSLAKRYDVIDDDFYVAYKKEKGDYKNLRTSKSQNNGITWDIERNRRLKDIVANIKERNIQWYETDIGDLRGLPTKEHVRCIMLGYSPDPTKLKKLMADVASKIGVIDDIDMEVEEEITKKTTKRSHDKNTSSSESESSEPDRKVAKLSSDVEGEKKEDSGLSFKDKEKALQSIKSLEGRDLSYQYHAIAGLVKRAERVISCTKDIKKIKNMKEAVQLFEDWITDYNVNGRSQDNFNYLSIDVIRAFEPLAKKYDIEDKGILKAYEEVDGDYKKLRTLQVPESDLTWDKKRNKFLREFVDRMKEEDISWFETDGDLQSLPTKEHARCIMWAYSPDPTKLKKLVSVVIEKLASTV
ncbi:uncharacterized protein LOC122629536 [Vespula pensylvanica]|uniref:Uncharacterized protein n=1 Tax=Vespula pensylvanica TaxID=30213 RepID=A0A834UAV1_VESPE|nr:uncharacterized protein LOC122629536 [Vespula pensylvanica]XP_043669003.1 uncharacterized protein LOC122629536 [Vespula pensylvanica]KAF7427024.1 hypothetical protein H0235_006718 [Vespula pensylvanica]